MLLPLLLFIPGKAFPSGDAEACSLPREIELLFDGETTAKEFETLLTSIAGTFLPPPLLLLLEDLVSAGEDCCFWKNFKGLEEEDGNEELESADDRGEGCFGELDWVEEPEETKAFWLSCSFCASSFWNWKFKLAI